jgi:type I restriction enzyme S subunit
MDKEEKPSTTATPRLRFPEFREAEEWDFKQAGDLFANRIEAGENGLPIYSVTIDDGMVKRSSLERKVDDILESGGNKKVNKRDMAYNMMRMWQGAFGVAVEDCMVSPAYVVLEPQSEVLPAFYASFLKLPQSLRLLTSRSHGLTKDRLRLYYRDFALIPLPLPSHAEQQKIADCLTSLDEVIAAQGRKVAALAAHKRGLMQQLFPREGESRPRLRFPEFREGAEWKEKNLGSLVEINSGYSPSHYVLSDIGPYPFVKVEDLNNCVKYQEEAREYSNDTEGLIPSQSVIFPKRGAAIALNKIRISARDILMDTNMMSLTPTDECGIEFMFYFISEIGLDTIADSSTIPQINNKHIIPFKVQVPSPPEQQRIAACLSALDARIAAESDKLDALKTHKKGLMQQLFPAAEGN